MANPTLRQLELFQSIVLSGSVTSAADALGISQPAASKAVRDLEALLGFKLFLRGGRRLNLTEDGEQFFGEAERMLHAHQEMERQIVSIRGGSEGRLSIACEPAWGSAVFTPILAALMRERPRASIAVYPMIGAHLHAWMSAGMVDVAIMSVAIDNPNFSREVLARTPAVLILPAGHRLAAQRSVHALDTVGESFITLSSRSDLATYRSTTIFNELGLERRIALSSPLTESVFALVAEGLGISIVSRMVAESVGHRYGVVSRPFLPASFYRVFAYRRREQRGSSLAEAFLKLCRSNLVRT